MRGGGRGAATKQRVTDNSILAVVAAAAAVVGVVVVVIVNNPFTEGVVVAGVGSDIRPTAESLSRTRAGQEVGFGLGLGFGFEFFDSELLLLDYLIFMEVLFPLFLFLFLAPLLPFFVVSVSALGFTT